MAIAWAPILVRWSTLGPSATAFWRVALALPLWALALGVSTGRAPMRHAPTSGSWAPLLLAGLFFSADLCLWHVSILRTSVANATLLANLAPLFVALAAFLFFGERLGRLHIAALGVSLAGVFLLMRSSAVGPRGDLTGDLFGVATAVAYAAYLVTVGRARQRFSTAAVMTGVSLAGTPLLLIAALLEEGSLLPSSWGELAPLVGLALVAQGAGQGAVAFGLARLPASFGSVVLLLQPVIAAFLAWPLFGETLGPMEAVGGFTVLLGIALAHRILRQPSRREGAG